MKLRAYITALHAALFAIILAVSPAGSGSMTLMGAGKPTAAVVSSFTGPGDLSGLSGATAFYGFRAYNAAYATGSNPCVDIQRASDSTTNTFNILSTGFCDFAGIATFLTATTGKITKWYDQVGTRHATAAVGPFFAANPSGLGSGTGAARFTSAASLSTPTTFTIAQPFFISAVSIRRSGSSFIGLAAGSSTAAPGLLYSNANNNMTVFAGSVANSPIGTEPLWTAAGGLFSGASSALYVNGTGSGALSAGATGFSGQGITIGEWSAVVLDGDIAEIIIYPSDVSANAAALSANQKSATFGYNF